MNPTHFPYPAALVTAASQYYGVPYRQYSVSHNKRDKYTLYNLYPTRAVEHAPPLIIREDGEGCRFVTGSQFQFPHLCNAWCCAYAWMMNVSRLEAA